MRREKIVGAGIVGGLLLVLIVVLVLRLTLTKDKPLTSLISSHAEERRAAPPAGREPVVLEGKRDVRPATQEPAQWTAAAAEARPSYMPKPGNQRPTEGVKLAALNEPVAADAAPPGPQMLLAANAAGFPSLLPAPSAAAASSTPPAASQAPSAVSVTPSPAPAPAAANPPAAVVVPSNPPPASAAIPAATPPTASVPAAPEAAPAPIAISPPASALMSVPAVPQPIVAAPPTPSSPLPPAMAMPSTSPLPPTAPPMVTPSDAAAQPTLPSFTPAVDRDAAAPAGPPPTFRRTSRYDMGGEGYGLGGGTSNLGGMSGGRMSGELGRHHEGTYKVQPNDNYWSISLRVYGTGAYFKALAEQNRGKIARDDRLQPGSVVQTPPIPELEKNHPDLCPKPNHRRPPVAMRAASVSPVGQYGGGRRVYVVREGDTLTDIAKFELGKRSRWGEIYELNRDRLGEDYDYLVPGTELVMPEGEPAGNAAGGPAGNLTNRPGATYNR